MNPRIRLCFVRINVLAMLVPNEARILTRLYLNAIPFMPARVFQYGPEGPAIRPWFLRSKRLRCGPRPSVVLHDGGGVALPDTSPRRAVTYNRPDPLIDKYSRPTRLFTHERCAAA